MTKFAGFRLRGQGKPKEAHTQTLPPAHENKDAQQRVMQKIGIWAKPSLPCLPMSLAIG